MRLPWAQLDALLDGLTVKLMAGKIDMLDYVDEWDDIIVFAGWTWEEFADEVDKHWTKQKKDASLLFRC